MTAGEYLTLRVADDGVGLPADTTPIGHGIDNMEARSAQRGGTCTISASAPTGTVLVWRVPAL
jgi:signal transduction histidine kinase